jgi:hypothetical protein
MALIAGYQGERVSTGCAFLVETAASSHRSVNIKQKRRFF